MRRGADESPGRRTPADDAPSPSVETSMYRPLAVLRVLLLLNALGLFVYRGLTAGRGSWSNTDHVTWAFVVMAALVVWTAVVVRAYDRPSRRGPPLLVVDLLVALAA